MTAPGSIAWLARHELMLTWRDFIAMMTGGKAGRERAVAVFGVAAVVLLHVLAWGLVSSSRGPLGEAAIDRWITITAILALPFALMTSQAMESVTRAFYARSDLDLILSSPISVRRLFAVRIGAIVLSTTALSLLIGAPLINVLAIVDYPGWLAAYPVLLAMAAMATVISLSATVFLFKTIGAKRTRLAAQIAAAAVGASFVIGIQLAAISSMGTLSRIGFLTSNLVREYLPDEMSLAWYPARAITGEPLPALSMIAIAAGAFAAAIVAFSGGFADKVIAAAGTGGGRRARDAGRLFVRKRSVRSALRHKEWKLLLRDHWLISQSLMQILYLVPPAFMLWKAFGTGGAMPVVAIPVLVMAAGQLAGGLAWLAVSGEDAPQLVATAPVRPAVVLQAKIEAVLGAMTAVVAPILIVMAWVDARLALISLCAIAAAAVSATFIQLWFRSQAKRSNFRRRQTSSKVATLAEAFSSIFWAGTAGMWASGSWFALALGGGALGVLMITRTIGRRSAEGQC